MSDDDRPRFVDEHQTTIDAPRERVWLALRRYCDNSLIKKPGNVLVRILGAEPTGFAIAEEVPTARLELSGRHRFSRYLLVFTLSDVVNGRTEVRALTFADFPGFLGRTYRALVIGSGAHVIAVRGMLRSIYRLSID